MAHWPYCTATWRKLRLAKLATSPVCEPCNRHGKVVVASTVDHVRSINAGGDPFPELSGLMAMCQPCHNTKTSAVDRKGGKGIRFPGAGIDGLPIDPDHPFIAGGDTPSKDDSLKALDRRGTRSCTKFDPGVW